MQAQRKNPNVLIEDCRLLYRNFAGKKERFNKEGDRNFTLVLSDKDVQRLEETGLPWNIKALKPRPGEENEPPTMSIKVKVQFPKPGSAGSPPKMVMITSRGKTKLDEETAGLLDWPTIITHCDLSIRPYNWTNEEEGTSGTTAYLVGIFANIEEDELEMKYADVPDSTPANVNYEPNEEY